MSFKKLLFFSQESNSRKSSCLALILSGFALFLCACATNPATGGRDFVTMSEDGEIAQGRKFHPQVMQQYKEYESPVLQALVKDIGTRLAESSERSHLIFRFTLLDSDQVNAFALPGGYIYITRGLLAYLNSEAELAGVLGHEIGHVTARHSVRQQSGSTLAGLAGFAVAMKTGSRAASDLANLLGTALISGYGRKMELEADSLGARYLAKNNYTPQALIDVISVLKDQELYDKERAKLEDREPRAYHGVFASHPRNDIRLREAIEAANVINPSAPKVNQSERELFIQKLDQLVFDKPAREGVTRGNSFYHEELDFTFDFPQNWRVENQANYIDLYAPANAALMRIGMEDLNKKISPREFLLERVNVKKMSDDEAITIDGLAAHTALGRGSTPYGTRTIRYTAVFHGEKAYIFQATAKDKNAHTAFDSDFLNTVKSFTRLSPEDKVKAQPQRIQLHRVQAGETIESLSASSPIPVYAAQQTRLLNALYPDKQPQVGQLIKLVR